MAYHEQKGGAPNTEKVNRELIKTADGSHTLFLPDVNEHYHSYHGAINESKHVFIKNGLEYYSEGKTGLPVNILEVGMGTGLNVFLTFLRSLQTGQAVNYTALEPFPVEKDIAEQLNYSALLNMEEHKSSFNLIHTSGFNVNVKLSDQFILAKRREKLEQFNSGEDFDIVFYDAFAPRVQPELWTKEVFERLYTFIKPGGILVTYCAKGEVKRNLRAANFKVESLPGPQGKREMIRVVKLI